MAQFDLHRYRGPVSGVRYLVDLQDDLLSPLRTRVVAPVYELDALPSITDLTPDIEVEGRAHRVAVMELAAVRTEELGAVAASAEPARTELIRALDRLFTGI